MNIFQKNPLENTADIDTKNRTHKKHARVAQWLEHWSSKPGVDSSILSSGIKKFPFFFSIILSIHLPQILNYILRSFSKYFF